MKPQNVFSVIDQGSKAILFCILLLTISLFHLDTAAQTVTERPKIGLVLSGGGAHGIAHLGVIKVMEESGLRPDYITGVSMGSIVGGFYSIGYSADSIYRIMKKIDWESLLSNKISENNVIFLEKGHFDNSIISLPLSGKKVQFPSGLINGQQVENTLNFYAFPAADIDDFSKLPIPYLCVASDLITYKRIDLRKGYLPDAIRASFSVPSIFTPLKMDTLLLVDGGLIRNFAASEVKEMGADVIIGSYVGFEALKPEELESVAGIMKQITLFRSLEDFENEKKYVNLLIKPDISGLSITDFNNVDSLISRGYKAALPYKQYFIKLADSLNRIEPQKQLSNILDKQSYVFSQINIVGNRNYSYEQITGVLNIEPFEKVDKYMLNRGIELLYGKAWFEKVKYRILPKNESLILELECIEKPKAMLYGSMHYDNSLNSGILLGLSVKNLLTQRSVININSFIGQYYRIGFNSIQFIDKNQKFGLSAGFHAENTLIPMLELRGDFGDMLSRNFTPSIAISKSLGLNHMMSISSNYENLSLIFHYSNNSHLKYLSYNYITTVFDYKINTLDTKHFPKKGMIFNLSAGTSRLISGGIKTDSSKIVFSERRSGYFSFNRFYTLFGNYTQYFSNKRNTTFSIGGDILYITDSDSISAQNNFFLLGGISPLTKRSIPMTGFHSNQIPVKSAAGIRTCLDIELMKNLHMELKADVYAVQTANSEKGLSLISGYGLGFGYLSVIGPLRIGIMQGNSNRKEFFSKTKGYISLGYNF
jgi:NTE family protein